MSLYTEFTTSTKTSLQDRLKKGNIHEVPVLQKVIVAMGIGSLATRKGVKDFSDLEENLTTITGQRPQQLFSKKSVSNFKLREGMPMMLKTTLRRKKAYDFVEKLAKFTLPRVRDFEGLSLRKFDGRGNYTLGFPSQIVFPELDPESIKTPMGVQVSLVTTADTDAEAQALLETLGIIFEKKQA